MARYNDIRDLIERFMDESGETERWVTVNELREMCGLEQDRCTTISRFLRRLNEGAFRQFPYIVQKIERLPGSSPSQTRGKRYLLKLRDSYTAKSKTIRNMEAAHGM